MWNAGTTTTTGTEIGEAGGGVRERSLKILCYPEFLTLGMLEGNSVVYLAQQFLIPEEPQQKVRPQCWCSKSVGNVQIFNCCVCCTMQVCSCAFSVRLPLSYVFLLF